MRLFLIRGLPGTGKTTLASLIVQGTAPTAMFAADDYFYDSEGNYNFQAIKLSEAHETCLHGVKIAMLFKLPIIAVHNTFVKKWEMVPYSDLAHKMGYSVSTIICTTPFGSTHNVPLEKIESMRLNFQY